MLSVMYRTLWRRSLGCLLAGRATAEAPAHPPSANRRVSARGLRRAQIVIAGIAVCLLLALPATRAQAALTPNWSPQPVRSGRRSRGQAVRRLVHLIGEVHRSRLLERRDDPLDAAHRTLERDGVVDPAESEPDSAAQQRPARRVVQLSRRVRGSWIGPRPLGKQDAAGRAVERLAVVDYGDPEPGRRVGQHLQQRVVHRPGPVLRRRVVTGSTGQLPLVERLAAATWSIPPTPTLVNPYASYAPSEDVLRAVSCASDTACLAVGSAETTTNLCSTLAERWNGTAWSVTPSACDQSPSLPNADTDLYGVSCTSRAACTVVGELGVEEFGHVPLSLPGERQALVVRNRIPPRRRRGEQLRLPA